MTDRETVATPAPTWLVECKRNGEQDWWLTAVPQATGRCPRCGGDIFSKQRDSEHRA